MSSNSLKVQSKAVARINPARAAAVRAQINASKLTKRLAAHVDGKVEMSPTQVDAAKFLLNKIIPNPPQRIEAEFTEYRLIIRDD